VTLSVYIEEGIQYEEAISTYTPWAIKKCHLIFNGYQTCNVIQLWHHQMI